MSCLAYRDEVKVGLCVSDDVSENVTGRNALACHTDMAGSQCRIRKRLASKQEKRGLYVPCGWAVF